MTTPVAYIDETGIHRPTQSECLNYVADAYRSIYGQDVYIDPDSQDGQLLGLIGTIIDDANAMCVSAYNAFSPSTAQGVGLSRVVKINGISRRVPSNSTAVVRVVGVAGTVITRGVAADERGNKWALPEFVTIPLTGEILVTATSMVTGAITAAPNSINRIDRGTAGWQTVNNNASAVPGAPVETDADLRQRQTFSASLPATSTFDGLKAAIAAIPGVSRYAIYTNDSSGADPNGVPGHSVAVIAYGGWDSHIAEAIHLKKGPGVRTVGTTAHQLSPDEFGLRRTVYFSRPVEVRVTYTIRVKALSGFTFDVLSLLKETVAAWTVAQPIGGIVEIANAYVTARMSGTPEGATFRILPDGIKIGRDGEPPTERDIELAYNEATFCYASYVAVVIT